MHPAVDCVKDDDCIANHYFIKSNVSLYLCHHAPIKQNKNRRKTQKTFSRNNQIVNNLENIHTQRYAC